MTSVIRSTGHGSTYLKFTSPETPFTTSIGLHTSSIHPPLEILWSKPDGGLSRGDSFLYESTRPLNTGTIEAATAFLDLLAETIEIARQIEAGKFDIESVPEEK